jgi:gliding motility-associated-like protein
LDEETAIVWHNYEYEFTLPIGHNKVNLVLINNGPGGCGNDILIDDISFSPCTPEPVIFTSDDLPACRFDILTLETTLPSGLSTAELQWFESNDGGLTFDEISGATQGQHETELVEDSLTYQLSATVQSGNGIDCPAWSNLLTIPTVLCPYVEFEGISPDGDGLNDYWHVNFIDIYPENTVKIYNRWGNLVWQAEGYDNSSVRWEGTSNNGITTGEVLPAGTYYYVISAVVEGEIDERTGIVMIN